jgi:hypothetical protein
VTKSDHEFHCPGVRLNDETSFVFCTAYSEEGEMVPLRQVNNCQLDEIFSLNSIFLFGYKLYFYDKSFQEKYSVIFSQYMKSMLVLI